MIEFRVSSFCSFGNCVEVGRSADGTVVMRDTKDRTQEPLAFADDVWSTFVADVKGGEYDLV